jgi:hypothetical protein
MNLQQFADRMRGYGERIIGNTDKLTQRIAIAVDEELVDATPIDTGKAKSNWVASLNSPIIGEEDSYYPGKKRSTEEAVKAAAKQQARFVILRYKGNIHSGIFIYNSAKHIRDLDRGTSNQAPRGFIKIATDKGLARSRYSTKLLDEYDVNVGY